MHLICVFVLEIECQENEDESSCQEEYWEEKYEFLVCPQAIICRTKCLVEVVLRQFTKVLVIEDKDEDRHDIEEHEEEYGQHIIHEEESIVAILRQRYEICTQHQVQTGTDTNL